MREIEVQISMFSLSNQNWIRVFGAVFGAELFDRFVKIKSAG